ncbi:hypothetical protein UJ101_01143 [Flavobacteriaceae bacterium UJ101]|nr:hypothetical protein UJ101_01143 [Flavobacteriaceae bacterium UJ101]
MKKYLFIWIIVFSFIALKATETKDVTSIFQKANQLQQNNQFKEALQLYQEIEVSNIQSDALFYNMGNAYYHLKQWGFARAYFEKALALDPTNQDIIVNLNLTLKEIEGPNFQRLNPSDNPVNLFTQYHWLLLIMLFTFILVVLFLFFKFISNKKLKNIILILSILNGFFLVFSLIGYSSYFFEEQEAIIIKDSKAHENPIEKSDVLKVLTSGKKIMVLEKIDDWTQIQEGNNIFWIKSDDLIEL